MKKRKRSFAVLLALLALVPFGWGNGLNLNSLGTRALTMGGAFVGLADDFSVVFWNPAGAAGFRSKYFGFYGTDLIPTNKYRIGCPLAGERHDPCQRQDQDEPLPGRNGRLLPSRFRQACPGSRRLSRRPALAANWEGPTSPRSRGANPTIGPARSGW